jgi:hypothetical protein
MEPDYWGSSTKYEDILSPEVILRGDFKYIISQMGKQNQIIVSVDFVNKCFLVN